MNRGFIGALLQLNAEKGVPQEILIRTLEQAIESAYRRNADAPENVVVTVNPESGEISVASRERPGPPSASPSSTRSGPASSAIRRSIASLA